MKLIIVTRQIDGTKVYVNPEHICAVFKHYQFPNRTIIQFPGSDENNIHVLESVDTVANMIENSKE
jgi:uncharacterized protein YlzI (FlbEa/FlbD family)